MGKVEESAAILGEILVSENLLGVFVLLGLGDIEVSVSIMGEIEVIEVSVIALLRDMYDSSSF